MNKGFSSFKLNVKYLKMEKISTTWCENEPLAK